MIQIGTWIWHSVTKSAQCALFVLCVIWGNSVAGAQSSPQATTRTAAELLLAGDSAFAALRPDTALKHYQAVLALEPNHVEALWKGARAAVVLGEFAHDTLAKRLLPLAQKFAVKAALLDMTSAQTQYAAAYATGRAALLIKEEMHRLPAGRAVYTYATRCLEIDSQNADCAHILGMWNVVVMMIPDTLKKIAIKRLNVTEFETASWENAIRYLEDAVRLEPNRIVHRHNLGVIAQQLKDTVKAKAALEAAIRLRPVEYNDKHYLESARAVLRLLSR